MREMNKLEGGHTNTQQTSNKITQNVCYEHKCTCTM